MVYEVIITKQARQSMKQVPETFDRERKIFKTHKQVKEFFKENYGNKRGKPIYADTKKGETRRVGTAFGYWLKNADWDRETGKPVSYFQNDWVEVRKVKYSYPKRF